MGTKSGKDEVKRPEELPARSRSWAWRTPQTLNIFLHWQIEANGGPAASDNNYRKIKKTIFKEVTLGSPSNTTLRILSVSGMWHL